MQLFFDEKLEAGESIIVLDEEESRHCFRSLRLAAGDLIEVTNGNGIRVVASLINSSGKNASAEVRTLEVLERPDHHLCIAVAPTKNHDRFEWFAEKATEFGISEIIPLITHHSERKNIHPARIRRLMIAAMKQSRTYFMPLLHEERLFSEVISAESHAQKFIAWCQGDEKPHLKDTLEKGRPALILIGPEGDFSNEEAEEAISLGFRPISLGKKRLRTETAALAACHIYNLINEDLA
jgi:16S rRNA (uracil1498-N3)-methyltransferase